MTGRDATGIRWVEARDVKKHLVHRTALTSKNDAGQSVNIAEIEKPWSKLCALCGESFGPREC